MSALLCSYGCAAPPSRYTLGYLLLQYPDGYPKHKTIMLCERALSVTVEQHLSHSPIGVNDELVLNRHLRLISNGESLEVGEVTRGASLQSLVQIYCHLLGFHHLVFTSLCLQISRYFVSCFFYIDAYNCFEIPAAQTPLPLLRRLTFSDQLHLINN